MECCACVFVKSALGYSCEETHNIRSRLCGVLCHWWWRMWHIEDKQAFPQTKIWGKPAFVFFTCLWNNHTVIVFLSIWITAVWEYILALSVIVCNFLQKGSPNISGLCDLRVCKMTYDGIWSIGRHFLGFSNIFIQRHLCKYIYACNLYWICILWQSVFSQIYVFSFSEIV